MKRVKSVTSNSSVVIDANLLIKLCVPEVLSDVAQKLNASWIEADVARVAPALVHYEVVSGLNKKVFTGLLTADEAVAALEASFGEGLELVTLPDIHRSALQLAMQLGLRSAYDAHYLAVAEELQCEFWTADQRLYNAVHESFPRVRWLGAAEPFPEDQPDEDR